MEQDSLSDCLFGGMNRAPLIRKRKEYKKTYKKGYFTNTCKLLRKADYSRIYDSILITPISRQAARNLIPVDVDTEGLVIKTHENED